jgi:hypothetical protein
MAFITTDSGICLSPMGTSVFPTCGEIITEPGVEYIQTEASENLMVDGACAQAAIPLFYCNIERKTVDKGKFVTIANTCTLPFTITGFRNSDPVRFSIFTEENYNDTYSSGNTTQLPLTIPPYSTVNIPTFFHPLRSELETGTAGTYDNMTGDKFGAKIEIYPGIPILNCSADEFDCDAFFTLTGQLVCDTVDVPDFLSNNDNFTTPDVSTLATIASYHCLQSTPTIGFQTVSDINSIENQYTGISGAADFFPDFLGDDWIDLYGDYGISGALGTFHQLITETMSRPLPWFIGDLLGASIEDYKVGEFVSGSYQANNYKIFEAGGYTYTGMQFEILSEQFPESTHNHTVFFNAEIVAGPPDDVRMFIVESGNYSEQPMCEAGT